MVDAVLDVRAAEVDGFRNQRRTTAGPSPIGERRRKQRRSP